MCSSLKCGHGAKPSFTALIDIDKEMKAARPVLKPTASAVKAAIYSSLAMKREAEHEARIKARIESAKAAKAAREESKDDNKPPVVFHECDKCGQEFHADSEFAVYPARGYRFCSSDCAYESEWTTCEECGDWVHNDYAQCLEDDQGNYVTLCSTACARNVGFLQCDGCGDWFHHASDDRMFTDDGWRRFCSDRCYTRAGYAYCVRCECEYHEDDGCQCDSARHRLQHYHADVFRYASQGKGSAAAYFKVNGYTKKHRLFGFEFEVKVNDLGYFLDAAESTTSDKGRGIWTEDGSVDAEYVSLPRPLVVHLRDLQHLFAAIDNDDHYHGAGEFQFCNDSNTGFHVHVSRSTLTPSTIGKLDSLLNAEGWRAFLERLAGRSADAGYCRFNDKTKGCGLATAKTAFSGGERDRYQALNINNEATVEFRLWRSPKNYTEAAYRLQATEALCEYASGPVDRRYPVDFVAFVMTDKGDRWQELKGFCAAYKD